jgi:hypothetical protein
VHEHHSYAEYVLTHVFFENSKSHINTQPTVRIWVSWALVYFFLLESKSMNETTEYCSPIEPEAIPVERMATAGHPTCSCMV